MMRRESKRKGGAGRDHPEASDQEIPEKTQKRRTYLWGGDNDCQIKGNRVSFAVH